MKRFLQGLSGVERGILALTLIAFLGIGIGIALGVDYRVQHRSEFSSASYIQRTFQWPRADEVKPPEMTPIIAVWAWSSASIDATYEKIDPKRAPGKATMPHAITDLDVRAVIEQGGEWFEYAPSLWPPLGGLITAEPPAWWAPMPGGAK